MKWDPDSIQKDWLIPEGDYEFEIIEAEDQNDQWEGKPQMFIKCRVFLDDGNTVQISQFIRQARAYLVDQLARSVGLIAEADAGEVDAEDLLNKTGRGFIHKYKKQNGQERNEFNKFHPLASDVKEKKLQKDIKEAEKEDDIPF